MIGAGDLRSPSWSSRGRALKAQLGRSRRSLRNRLREALLATGLQEEIVRLMVQSLKIAAVGVMALLIVLGGLKFFAYEPVGLR